MANTLTLKVMAEVVRRCSAEQGYRPMVQPQKSSMGSLSSAVARQETVLTTHPRQAKLLSDIASGRRRIDNDLSTASEDDGYEESPQQGAISKPNGPMSLNDWLSAQQKRR